MACASGVVSKYARRCPPKRSKCMSSSGPRGMASTWIISLPTIAVSPTANPVGETTRNAAIRRIAIGQRDRGFQHASHRGAFHGVALRIQHLQQRIQWRAEPVGVHLENQLLAFARLEPIVVFPASSLPFTVTGAVIGCAAAADVFFPVDATSGSSLSASFNSIEGLARRRFWAAELPPARLRARARPSRPPCPLRGCSRSE